MYASLNAKALGLPLTPEETLDFAAEFGFEGVDLLLRDIHEAGVDPRILRRKMDDLGLRGGAFALPMNWRGDRETFKRDLASLPRFAETAATLGLFRTGTWVMPESPRFEGSADETPSHLAEIARLHVERLGAIAKVLDRQGIRLGLEVIGVASSRTGSGLPFVHRLGDLDRILGAIWSVAPNAGILVDSFHLYAAGEPPEVALTWGANKVVWVHVADLPEGATRNREAIIDLNRGLPGENGAVETGALLRLLRENDYDGPVTAEPMPGCRSLSELSAGQTIERVAKALRSVWPV